MGELEFTTAAQHWVNVVLIWIGLGTLAGLLARSILPGREPGGAVATLVMGVAGSAIGLAVLSFFVWRLQADRPVNPISPLGMLSAASGAFVLLAAYRLVAAATSRRREEDAEL